jgi:hypothetical protein
MLTSKTLFVDKTLNSTNVKDNTQYLIMHAIFCIMEQRVLKIVNNCLSTNIYSSLEISGG